MSTVRMPKAQPIGDGAVPELTVVFADEIPSFDQVHTRDGLTAARSWYRREAERLLDAMERSVPGGLMDAMLGALLARKASIFVVPDYAEPAALPDLDKLVRYGRVVAGHVCDVVADRTGAEWVSLSQAQDAVARMEAGA